jgi:four helix bundle protein
MFLKLAHTKLDVYQCTKEMVLACYRVTKKFPGSERYALTQQIRRAALSIHLNLAEGCTRKSKAERKRYFEISRGSIIEVDTGLDIATELTYCSEAELQPTGQLIIRAFNMMSAMIEQ